MSDDGHGPIIREVLQLPQKEREAVRLGARIAQDVIARSVIGLASAEELAAFKELLGRTFAAPLGDDS